MNRVTAANTIPADFFISSDSTHQTAKFGRIQLDPALKGWTMVENEMDQKSVPTFPRHVQNQSQVV
jgi:hypothetical protein